MTVREARAEDFARIDLQDAQLLRAVPLSEEVGRAVLDKSNALSILGMSGECLAISGITERDADTGVVWVLLSRQAAKHMLGVTKILKEAMQLNSAGYKFVETVVNSDFVAGHRWARMFGFEKICAAGLDPDRQALDLYRRVNDDT